MNARIDYDFEGQGGDLEANSDSDDQTTALDNVSDFGEDVRDDFDTDAQSPQKVSKHLRREAEKFPVVSHEEMASYAREMWQIKKAMLEPFFTPERLKGLDYFVNKQPVKFCQIRKKRQDLYAKAQTNITSDTKEALIEEIIKTWPSNEMREVWLNVLSGPNNRDLQELLPHVTAGFARLKDIEEKFVHHNLRLAIGIAEGIRLSEAELKQLSKDDLVHEGVFGLQRAAQIWHPEYGAFTTYATQWVHQKIGNVRMGKGSLVDAPSWFWALNSQVYRANAVSFSQNGRPCSREEKIKLIGATKLAQDKTEETREQWIADTLAAIDQLSRSFAPSLDNSVKAGEDDTTFLDFCEGPPTYEPEERLSKRAINEVIGALFDFCAQNEVLTPRDEKVLRMRFGLTEDSQDYTLDEVRGLFGVSRERIRQIEKLALGKTRKIALQTPDKTSRGRMALRLQNVHNDIKFG